ncbi:MAG: hypothetical protein SGBAC_012361, partial [Bacillariaceae sp.]
MKRQREIEWRVYPPKKKQYVFCDGEDVLVKGKDGKTLKGKIRLDDPAQAKKELKKVEMKTDAKESSNLVPSKDQGTTTTSTDDSIRPLDASSISPKSKSPNLSVVLSEDQKTVLCLNTKEQKHRLLPNFALQAPNIVVTPETNFFRILAKQVTTEDRVLEIGCSTGETTKLLIPPN